MRIMRNRRPKATRRPQRQGGRTDIAIEDAPKSHEALMKQVPLEQRAGYPLVKPKVDPRDWRTLEGKAGR